MQGLGGEGLWRCGGGAEVPGGGRAEGCRGGGGAEGCTGAEAQSVHGAPVEQAAARGRARRHGVQEDLPRRVAAQQPGTGRVEVAAGEQLRVGRHEREGLRLLLHACTVGGVGGCRRSKGGARALLPGTADQPTRTPVHRHRATCTRARASSPPPAPAEAVRGGTRAPAGGWGGPSGCVGRAGPSVAALPARWGAARPRAGPEMRLARRALERPEQQTVPAHDARQKLRLGRGLEHDTVDPALRGALAPRRLQHRLAPAGQQPRRGVDGGCLWSGNQGGWSWSAVQIGRGTHLISVPTQVSRQT